MAKQIPDKLYFKIGEVADLVGVKSHVLRYWETEFKSLKPIKSRSNQRLYRREDIEQALLIKSLLYQQGFTLSGARQQLKNPQNIPIISLDSVIERVRSLRDRLQTDIAGEDE